MFLDKYYHPFRGSCMMYALGIRIQIFPCQYRKSSLILARLGSKYRLEVLHQTPVVRSGPPTIVSWTAQYPHSYVMQWFNEYRTVLFSYLVRFLLTRGTNRESRKTNSPPIQPKGGIEGGWNLDD